MLKIIKYYFPQLIGIFLATLVVASYASIDNADIVKVAQLDKAPVIHQVQNDQTQVLASIDMGSKIK